jgi:hypothetical protein
MKHDLPPTAAKGKFPYPHRTLAQVAHDDYVNRPARLWRLSWLQWKRRYHG